jgi:hypothetical protein
MRQLLLLSLAGLLVACEAQSSAPAADDPDRAELESMVELTPAEFLDRQAAAARADSIAFEQRRSAMSTLEQCLAQAETLPEPQRGRIEAACRRGRVD